MHPVKVAIHIDFEQRAGMIAGTARLGGLCFKTQSRDIETIDKNIDDANYAVFFHMYPVRHLSRPPNSVVYAGWRVDVERTTEKRTGAIVFESIWPANVAVMPSVRI